MYLHYHKENFFWFKGLNVKRNNKITKELIITNDLRTDVVNGDRRKNIEIDDDKCFLSNLYVGKYIKKLMNYIEEKENTKITPINQDFPLLYSVLDKNDEGLKIHCDTTLIDTSFHPRYFGCNIYLNDDYEGGELVFPLMNLKIKPEPGDMLSYRSNMQFLHYVRKVTSGQKWILQGYFRIRGDDE
jgi:hypothetical protein